MQFSLAQQNLEASTPLPQSSASCPAEPTLSNEDKGLIAVGVVLGVLIAVLAGLALYKYLNRPLTPEPATTTPASSNYPQPPPTPSEDSGR
jgi:hypothetical protein